jgi:hypothetical protein
LPASLAPKYSFPSLRVGGRVPKSHQTFFGAPMSNQHSFASACQFSISILDFDLQSTSTTSTLAIGLATRFRSEAANCFVVRLALCNSAL